ncbi:DNA cytosine methyltransferase [Elizabethkingia anophelis]|uniref:DNA cytosine methyltransferase n=1 Tax=Elizabethkingia anophelis TaxID=1117645 RepID=UPI001EE717A9|nr:DNA cytosine methyltransferase [Elizabethkingia anophelis]MDV3931285.1 DNA (cytosine-5-)-methyltransferase [Elizabethkingia anophelis]UKY87844.1 DNA cytosine methyltransferase [Elizabethkingia anophelis]UKZ01954.1 DNA cytosine methyltransferase [Elizabethkingia anophelis]
MRDRTFDILSLFSGGGFLDIGFINNGFQVVEAVEIQPFFIQAYNEGIQSYFEKSDNYYIRRNLIFHNEILKTTDASCLKEQRRLYKNHKQITGIIGGPPCQDYSIGGKNGGIEGERGRLIYSYFSIIKKLKPDFLFFENVEGLYRTRKHRISFDAFVEDIEKAGYYVWHDLLNVLEYGYPQDRPRIALVAFKKKICRKLIKAGYTLEFDNTILKYQHTEDLLFKWPEPTIRNPKALNWPKKWEFGNEIKTYELNENHQLFVDTVLGDLTDCYPNQCEFFIPKSPKFTQIDEGDTNRKSFKRLHRFRYSPTVAYGNNEVHLHPTKPRRLTVREGLRLQTVPDEYILSDKIPLTHKFKLISNGVPTAKAELIAKEIRRTLINYYTIL